MSLNRQRLVAALLLAGTLAIGWVAYSPALGGALLLDDVSNLGGLGSISDGLSALNFVFSGSAGPLGRPLTLATFASQAGAWGEGAESFLQVNILIHLLNALLLAWVLYRLSILRGVREGKALFVAVAAAAIWLFMPLLASSSLMIVQRMTTLSAFFVLLGLAGYLHARRTIERNTTMALIGMSGSLIVGATLAAFSKENGALLPTLVLVMEVTLLTRPASLRHLHWRVWTSVFLGLPTLLILAYLVSRVPYSADIVLRRDFSGWERLLTEARILWQYLFDAFIPQPGSFGPFHDSYPVARSILDPLTFLAVAGWLAVLTAAVAWRRRFPLFSFAVLWYLAGHLLESTVIPLELYFEHRNYLPIVGPVYALCMATTHIQASKRRLVYGGVTAYVILNALVLTSFTSLWGEPAMAARHWQQHFPESVRAATTVAQFQLGEDGPRATMQTLRHVVAEHPEAGYVKIQELNLACIVDPDAEHDHIVSELEDLLGNVDFSATAGAMLSQLFTTVSNVECNGVDGNTVRILADKLQSNPRYSNNTAYNQLHHQLIASILRHDKKWDETIRHLERAIAYGPSADLNMMMVTTYADARKFDAARDFIDEARRNRPLNPMARFVWLNRLDRLGRYIDELELHYRQDMR